jgi:hypothetical protein
VALKVSLDYLFCGQKSSFKQICNHGARIPTLHSGVCLAYYPPLPSAGIFAQVFQGPQQMDGTAFRSQTALSPFHVYVDLNMVRAGVVTHPSEWKWSGYHEIQQPKARYRLIDHKKLLALLDVDSSTALATAHRGWIASQLQRSPEREERYSKSIAIGSQSFVESVKVKMGIKAIGRRKRGVLGGGMNSGKRLKTMGMGLFKSQTGNSIVSILQNMEL